ncbi:MAG: hypothetical protein NTW14_06415 [bacterium]|nr:hypothetical protein [bacterium]
MGSSELIEGRLIQDGCQAGIFNMAADSLLAAFSRDTFIPVLRLYRWTNPTLSLGFHQKISVDQLNLCDQLGISVVRRPTGGRAVLHDNELTYCLTIPSEHPLLKFDRSEVQKRIGFVFVAAARQAGVHAELAREGFNNLSSRRKVSNSPLCFDSVSRWEVRLAGSKWIGSAQRYLPGVMLQHGSIILGRNNLDPAVVFGMAHRHDEPVFPADIMDTLSALPDLEVRLRREIPEAFCREWEILWREQPFDQKEINLILEDGKADTPHFESTISGTQIKHNSIDTINV